MMSMLLDIAECKQEGVSGKALYDTVSSYWVINFRGITSLLNSFPAPSNHAWQISVTHADSGMKQLNMA